MRIGRNQQQKIMNVPLLTTNTEGKSRPPALPGFRVSSIWFRKESGCFHKQQHLNSWLLSGTQQLLLPQLPQHLKQQCPEERLDLQNNPTLFRAWDLELDSGHGVLALLRTHLLLVWFINSYKNILIHKKYNDMCFKMIL